MTLDDGYLWNKVITNGNQITELSVLVFQLCRAGDRGRTLGDTRVMRGE